MTATTPELFGGINFGQLLDKQLHICIIESISKHQSQKGFTMLNHEIAKMSPFERVRFFTRESGGIFIQSVVNGYIIEADRHGAKLVNTRTLTTGVAYSTEYVRIDNYVHTPIRNFMHAWQLAASK